MRFLLSFCLLTCLAVSETQAQKPVVAPKPNLKIGPVLKPLVAEKPDIPADPLAGHSQHGEAFNEGPRQSAYLIGGTGPVHFPVTSDHPDVQKFVEQGIGQIHGYWYFEAERSFRQAAKLDPNCAIAYWGMAMANVNNSKRSKGFIAEAGKRIPFASEREAMYIDILYNYINYKDRKTKDAEYVAGIQKLVRAYPDDLEALAWLTHETYKKRSKLKKKYEDVDELLNQVLAREPMHPVHHFRIHLWDYKDPKKALKAASLCGQAAPSIAHMWHMPGHIYSRLKRYEDAVWQQEASARTDHRHMIHDRVLPDQIHNFAHNNEWLIRNFVYLGRHRDALDLAKNMSDLPRHPKYNIISKRRSAYYGRLRLFQVLKEFELWDTMIVLCHGPHLEPTTSTTEQVKRLQHLGIAYARIGDTQGVKEVMADLQPRYDKLKKEEDAKKKKNPKHRTSSTLRTLQKAIDAIKGHQAYFDQDYKTAYTLMKKAGESTVVTTPVQALMGQGDAAIKVIEKYASTRQNQVLPQAALVEVLWTAGKKEKAAEEFAKLQRISGSLQFGSPVFHRLDPLIESLGVRKDWRILRAPSVDAGERPPLDALGPFRWHPTAAPQWTLTNPKGQTVSLNDYKGRPVVVIFYLGFGCLHCAEQLQAFGPKIEEFRKQGIEVLAISTEDQESLKRGLSDYSGKAIPFPLLPNGDLEVFKKYRAYDDFEETPLHGTFLIDGQGLVRWQDISYEPFMDVDFVLKESKRLLAQPKWNLDEYEPATVGNICEGDEEK